MVFADELRGEEVADAVAVEHRLGQAIPCQGKDQLLADLGPAVDPGGELGLDGLLPAGPEIGKAAGGGVRAGLLPEIPKGFQSLELIAVVGVQKGNIVPLGLVDSQVSGLADALVLLPVKDANPIVLGGEPVAQGGGAVGGPVIHQDELPIGKGLAGYAVETAVQELLRLVDGDDDRDTGHRRPPWGPAAAFNLKLKRGPSRGRPPAMAAAAGI